MSGQHSVFQAIIPSRGNPKFALKCFLLTVPERLSCAGVCKCTLTAASAAQEFEGGVKEGKKKKRKQMICVYAGEVKSRYFLQSHFRSLPFTDETKLKKTKTSSQCHQSASSASHRGKKKYVYTSDPSQLCYPHPTGSVAVNLFPLSLHLFFLRQHPPPTATFSGVGGVFKISGWRVITVTVWRS